ncbi:MAG: 2-amino-4-hydroxy-6-hydroxymethyldihydropteridine diphosphokinase [Myxococcales bacterium]|nr:2-amino-4-hydroxy-6-hydroxymethyldihydropteridine diphosphokinase [Myxococcales bacterium]
MSRAYIGLGANLGDRALQLRQALSLLASPDCRVTRVSRVYETAPVGPVAAQPPFYNAVAELDCRLDARALLRRALDVEARLGRARSATTVPKGPRLIDLDVLLYDDQIGAWPELSLPHPELRARRFVLAPLLELEPELRDPRDDQPLQAALASLLDQRVEPRGVLDALAEGEQTARSRQRSAAC